MNINQEMQVDPTVFYNRADNLDLPEAAVQVRLNRQLWEVAATYLN